MIMDLACFTVPYQHTKTCPVYCTYNAFWRQWFFVLLLVNYLSLLLCATRPRNLLRIYVYHTVPSSSHLLFSLPPYHPTYPTFIIATPPLLIYNHDTHIAKPQQKKVSATAYFISILFLNSESTKHRRHFNHYHHLWDMYIHVRIRRELRYCATVCNP